MSSHDLQSELSLIRAANPVSVPVELIRAKRTAGAAFSLACDCSGLEDKEIYMALDLDAGRSAGPAKAPTPWRGIW